MGGSNATLSIVLQLVDDLSSALSGVSQSTEQALKGIQSQADSVRNTFGLLGGAIIGGLGVLVDAAANTDTAQSQLTTAVNAGITAANQDTGATSVLAKEKANLQLQLDGVNAKIVEYTQKLNSGSAASGGYADTIATLETKQATLQSQLQDVNNSMALVGASTAQLSQQFMGAANANTALGFSVDDSLASYTLLFRATDSVSQSMQANQVAMDLSRATGLDLASAAKQVELAMEGNGRALKQFGINLKDGLSPAEALIELQQKLAGTAQDYVNTPWGQLDVATAKSNMLEAAIGNDLIPTLENFLQTVTPLIQKVTEWTDAHPKLTTDILLAVGAVGLLSLAIAGVAAAISTAISIFLAASTVVAAVGIVIGALSLPLLLIIAVVAILAIAIFMHWHDIIDWTSDMMLNVANAWTTGWNAVVTFFEGIATKIMNILNPIINAVKSVGSAVGGIVGAVGGAVGGAVSGVVHAFATGGIVNGPTLAMVGEAGPEAIIPLSAFAGGSSLRGAGGGAAGGVNVYIQGGMYLDSGGATMIANAIGQQIVRQLKVSNF
jgi:hypothetical protein